MSKNKLRKFMPGLMPSVMLCLSSCAKTAYNHCPIYPKAGSDVAAEVQTLSAQDYPHTWEWIGRIDKLRQELELCQQNKGE